MGEKKEKKDKEKKEKKEKATVRSAPDGSDNKELRLKYLLIEVIIEITPQSPKAIIVRIDGSKGKNRHPPPQPPRHPHL